MGASHHVPVSSSPTPALVFASLPNRLSTCLCPFVQIPLGQPRLDATRPRARVLYRSWKTPFPGLFWTFCLSTPRPSHPCRSRERCPMSRYHIFTFGRRSLRLFFLAALALSPAVRTPAFSSDLLTHSALGQLKFVVNNPLLAQ
jgi:hypothetical protein